MVNMVNNTDKKTRFDIRIYILLAFIIIPTILAICFSSGNVGFNNEEAVFLNNGWTHIKNDGSRQEITLPANLDTPAGEKTIIETVLPKDLEQKSSICLRASMQSVCAYLDGEVIYEFSMRKNPLAKSDVGSIWTLFRLPNDSGSKTLRIELSSPYDSFSGKISEIYCSSKASILFDIFGNYSMGFFIFIVLIIIGMVLLITFFATLGSIQKNQALLYIALFSITVGLWVFGESKTAQFLIGNEYLVSKFSFYSLLVIPLTFTLYIDSAYTRHTPPYAKFFFWLFTANLTVCVLLELTGTASFFSTLISVHVMLLALLVVTSAALSYETIRHHNHDAYIQLIGLCILGLSGVLELIVMWFNLYNFVSKFLRVGILLYVAYMGVVTIKSQLKYAQESREVEYFERLAYTDVVTNGNNRMAFERDAEKAFVHGGDTGNWLVLFDLDNLKIINDTIGHQAGDEAIRHAYQCITDAFTKVGISYRIGGDEFACILLSASENTVDECLKELDELVRQKQQTVDYNFGLSYGKGVFNPEKESFHKFYISVDKRMYSNKEKKRKPKEIFT